PADEPLGPKRHAISSAAAPDADALAEAADMIAAAKAPLLIAQRADPEGRLAPVLGAFCDQWAIPVAGFWPSLNVMATDHPKHMGADPGARLSNADVVIVLDALVPWIESGLKPNPKAKIIQIGSDPMFSRVPVRGFRSTLNLTAKPAVAIEALSKTLRRRRKDLKGVLSKRHAALSKQNRARRTAALRQADEGGGSPMTPAFVSKCLSDTLPADARVFGELGCIPSVMHFENGNQFFSHPLAGGLGWGVPAALGASLSDPSRVTVACVGDGSYMFANPVACHQIAEASNLPLLTIVFNNGVWNAVRKTTTMMYPDGKASRVNTMALSSLDPSPDYAMVAAASRAWSTTVEKGEDLPGALNEALRVMAEEKRQAMIEVMVTKD
ncbi:MAG: thiamine pyrophosphate-dependent enzyme, partial [Pseudomonadota bacterium]